MFLWTSEGCSSSRFPAVWRNPRDTDADACYRLWSEERTRVNQQHTDGRREKKHTGWTEENNIWMRGTSRRLLEIIIIREKRRMTDAFCSRAQIIHLPEALWECHERRRVELESFRVDEGFHQPRACWTSHRHKHAPFQKSYSLISSDWWGENVSWCFTAETELVS